jgi:hypothetical protein
MNITLKILFAVFVSLLAGCAGSGNYSKTYRQLVEPVGEVDAFMLDKGARPRLIISENFDDDLKTFTDQNYIVLGESDFNAPPEKFDDAVNIGEKLGVTHILVKIEYLYDAQKKAYKFYENYDYVREVQLINGRYYPVYQAIPDPVAVPYYKKFAIYRHKAVYLVKLKAVQ